MTKLRGWFLMVELEHSRELLNDFGLATAAELSGCQVGGSFPS